jgi:hypothetical protein
MSKSRPRKAHRASNAGSSSPPQPKSYALGDWPTGAQQPGALADRFARLQDDIRQSADPAPDPAACDELEPMLDAYLDAIVCGAKPSRRFAPLKTHATVCAKCRSIIEAVQAEMDIDVAPSQGRQSPVRYPFVLHAAKEYISRPRPQLSGAQAGMTLQIAPALIAAKLNPLPSAMRVRGHASNDGQFLSGRATIDAEPWIFSATVQRQPEERGLLILCAKLVSDRYPALSVTLHWGKERITRPAEPDGTVCFEHLPEAVISHADALILLDVEPLC